MTSCTAIFSRATFYSFFLMYFKNKFRKVLFCPNFLHSSIMFHAASVLKTKCVNSPTHPPKNPSHIALRLILGRFPVNLLQIPDFILNKKGRTVKFVFVLLLIYPFIQMKCVIQNCFLHIHKFKKKMTQE